MNMHKIFRSEKARYERHRIDQNLTFKSNILSRIFCFISLYLEIRSKDCLALLFYRSSDTDRAAMKPISSL